MQNLGREMVLKPLPTFDIGSQKYVGEGISSMTTVSNTTNEAASQNSKIDNDDEEESRARHQCRPYLIFEIVKTLSERDGWGERLAYFKKTGFGDVLRIAHWKSGLPSEFVKFVVDNFEAKEMRIRLGANHVLALHDTDVKRVYNLPLGGTEVNVIRCDKELLCALKKDLGIKDGTSSKIVRDTVIAEALLRETDDIKWSKLMILYILGTLLCPSNHANINMDYANLLEDVQKIRDYDWCGHVLKYMQSGISYQGCRSPKADFHFLLINYLDRMAAESPLETGRFQVPTCDLLDYERSRKRLKKIGEIMSLKNGVTFGWTSTCTANVPITFDLDNCPFEKVSVYADWVRLQLSIYTKMLQTLEERMEKEGIREADEHKKKKLAAGRTKNAMKRIAKRTEVNKPAKRAKLGKGKTPAIHTNDVENVVTVSGGNPNEAENVLEDPTAIHGDEVENALIGSRVNPNEPENVLGDPMEKADVDVTNLENAEPSMIPNVTEHVEDNGPLVTDRVVDSNISSMKKSNYARKKKNVKEQYVIEQPCIGCNHKFQFYILLSDP